ncbi:uncharacterized protein EV422DRAFT_387657 [Fimicolochytrium jonesii]|uniref:uncharacterized protein n=1 Tax=Fimicolochytrium jonesii TaxID=1396493 RepID=UPI0022FE2AE0|nr:uncharacterized protein EV422DRAFT_387657 [Fimicolochytrium jonesii]KAI8823002.1 hypothetical protein EV422DRAFT_387657 [Fimicolochytrium jonesii]
MLRGLAIMAIPALTFGIRAAWVRNKASTVGCASSHRTVIDLNQDHCITHGDVGVEFQVLPRNRIVSVQCTRAALDGVGRIKVERDAHRVVHVVGVAAQGLAESDSSG